MDQDPSARTVGLRPFRSFRWDFPNDVRKQGRMVQTACTVGLLQSVHVVARETRNDEAATFHDDHDLVVAKRHVVDETCPVPPFRMA